jgi:hypothetical protein
MQAAPRLDLPLVGALLLAAVVGVLFWHAWPVYPFKLLVVLMHESGHAFATLLVGGSVDLISVSPNEGGVTWSRYSPTLLHRIVVSSAGYVGSTFSGCVLLFAASRSKEARAPLYALSLWTASVALLWVRDLFTLAFTLGSAAAFAALGRWGPLPLRRGLLAFLASFSLLYAFFDIQDDLLHLAPRSGSDAEAMAQATFIPAIVWGTAWGLVSLALLALTLRLSVVRSGAPAPIRGKPGPID